MESNVRQQHSTQNIKTTIFTSLPLLVSLLGGVLFSSSLLAAGTYEIKSGDSLSKIVAKNYPDVARQSYGIIMKDIFKNNPDAFSKNNINSLRLGKTLQLTDKDKIEGLKPKPPAPKPVNPAEFKKLQEQNAELEKQIQSLKEKLSSDGGDVESATQSTTGASSADNAALEQKIKDLEEALSKKQERIQSLEKEKEKADVANEKNVLEDIKIKNEQLQALVTKLEAENEELSKVDVSALEKQLADAKAEVEQQKILLAEANKAKSEQAKQADNNAELDAANKQIDDLKIQLDQLNALLAKYEAEQENSQTSDASGNTTADGKKLEDLQIELEQLQALATKYEKDQEDSDALVKQLQEKLKAATDASAEAGTISTTDTNALNEQVATLKAELEALTQENTSLKADIEKQQSKSSQDEATIKQLQSELAAITDKLTAKSQNLPEETATEVGANKSSSSWLNLSIFSWLLPLLAILIGLYLLSRLIKRNRDRKATEDFKTAMVTSGSANTAAAFGIDGSAPEPFTTTPDKVEAPEEDSFEAGVKIDIAKAYIDLQDIEAANEILQEVMVEGSSSQRQEAEKLQG